MFLKILVSILVLLSATFAIANQAKEYNALVKTSTIRPLEQVNSSVWRSGRPTLDSLKEAYAKGVRIIINLESKQSAIDREVVFAQQLGFKFYSFPMNSMMKPTDSMVKEILALLRNPQAPTLVHCHHGQDRTGLIIGLERVFIEAWTPQNAYTEMLDKGFHRQLIALDHYFRVKTNL